MIIAAACGRHPGELTADDREKVATAKDQKDGDVSIHHGGQQ